jgi:hypothetical protein
MLLCAWFPPAFCTAEPLILTLVAAPPPRLSRDDLGSPDRFDVYYGIADYRIGVARLDLPDFVPPVGVADAPERCSREFPLRLFRAEICPISMDAIAAEVAWSWRYHWGRRR